VHAVRHDGWSSWFTAAAALVWENRVLMHLQLFLKVADQEEGGSPPRRTRIHIRYTRPWGPVW